MRRLVLLGMLFVGATPHPATAQVPADWAWGLTASVSPRWSSRSPLQSFVIDGDGTLTGSELVIGVVRGRADGARWGLSFVSKPIDDGSGVTALTEQCLRDIKCFPADLRTLTDHVILKGIRLEAFVPVVALGRHARVGVALGGGLAAVSGSVVETVASFSVTGVNASTGEIVLTPSESVTTRPARDAWTRWFPLASLEAEGIVTVAASLRLTIAAGLNFPGVAFRTGVIYWF